jgi:hypothetical protein
VKNFLRWLSSLIRRQPSPASLADWREDYTGRHVCTLWTPYDVWEERERSGPGLTCRHWHAPWPYATSPEDYWSTHWRNRHGYVPWGRPLWRDGTKEDAR